MKNIFCGYRMSLQKETCLSVLLKTLIEVILENKDYQTAAHGILLLPLWLQLNGEIEHPHMLNKKAEDSSYEDPKEIWWGLNDQWVKKIAEKFQKVFQKDERFNAS